MKTSLVILLALSIFGCDKGGGDDDKAKGPIAALEAEGMQSHDLELEGVAFSVEMPKNHKFEEHKLGEKIDSYIWSHEKGSMPYFTINHDGISTDTSLEKFLAGHTRRKDYDLLTQEQFPDGSFVVTEQSPKYKGLKTRYIIPIGKNEVIYCFASYDKKKDTDAAKAFLEKTCRTLKKK